MGNVVLLERQQFIEQLSALVDSSPRRSLLININGFRERFPSALRKTAFLGHVLDINVPMDAIVDKTAGGRFKLKSLIREVILSRADF